ncbi:hypothetical protein [Desulfoplanes sp.]
MSVWVWWAVYTVLAVWAQEFFGGMDFFSPGLIVFLQAGRFKSCLWVGLVWGILQEGAGSLSFGAVLLFDVGLVGMFFLGKWLLEPENPVFVMVLSAVLVLWQAVVTVGLATLQDLHVSWPSGSFLALQFLAYVLTWAFVYPLFTKVVPRAAT